MLKIKNKYLIGLASWLDNLKLSGKQSRVRTRFVSVLKEEIAKFQNAYVKLLEEYVDRNEDGSFEQKEREGQKLFNVPDDKEDEFMERYQELSEEEVEIEYSGFEQDAEVLKDLVLNTDYEFGPDEDDEGTEKQAKIRQAEDYVKWCESFEELNV